MSHPRIESHYLNKPASSTRLPVKKYGKYHVTHTGAYKTIEQTFDAVSENHALLTARAAWGDVDGGRWKVEPLGSGCNG